MDFEWDEAKRLSNLAKHGLDFLDAIEVLEREHLVLPTHSVADEERRIAVGHIGDLAVAMI